MVNSPQVADRRGVLRILVVSSRPEDGRIARELQHPSVDFRIHTTRSIEEAGEALEQGSFDAALVDSLLWHDDRVRVVRSLREQHPDVAVVLLTSHDEGHEALPALKLGARDFLDRQQLGDAAEVTARILAAVEENRSLRRRDTMVRWLEREARTDHLTGLYNRRAFDDRLKEACHQARASRQPLAVLLLDLSGTRMVNEAHGHAAGDQMIRRTAAVIGRCIRGCDFAARIGGDDFGIIVPDGDLDLARRIARRIAQELERSNTEENEFGIPATVAFGVASAVACDPDEIFSAADRQLSEHKSIPPVLRAFRPMDENDGPSVA